MKFSVNWCRQVTLLLASLMVSGCWPSPQGQSDEEKEKNFIEGRSRVNAMDYEGAVESFERALEVNPQSASAHFELGWLLDLKQPDAAAAIYHYEKYLKLRPGAHDADNVRERILACKQELARTVWLGPISEKQQRDLQKLAEENKQLAEQNRQMSEDLAKWRAYAVGAQLDRGARQPPRCRMRRWQGSRARG
jgi:tetratricopeptide (TPR) repeat protein